MQGKAKQSSCCLDLEAALVGLGKSPEALEVPSPRYCDRPTTVTPSQLIRVLKAVKLASELSNQQEQPQREEGHPDAGVAVSSDAAEADKEAATVTTVALTNALPPTKASSTVTQLLQASPLITV